MKLPKLNIKSIPKLKDKVEQKDQKMENTKEM